MTDKALKVSNANIHMYIFYKISHYNLQGQLFQMCICYTFSPVSPRSPDFLSQLEETKTLQNEQPAGSGLLGVQGRGSG